MTAAPEACRPAAGRRRRRTRRPASVLAIPPLRAVALPGHAHHAVRRLHQRLRGAARVGGLGAPAPSPACSGSTRRCCCWPAAPRSRSPAAGCGAGTPGARAWLAAHGSAGRALRGAARSPAWRALAAQGVCLASNPHSSFFYLLTGLHVAPPGGRRWSGSRWSSGRRGRLAYTPGQDGLGLFATYWHFLDGLWVYLFAAAVRLLRRTSACTTADAAVMESHWGGGAAPFGASWQKTMMWIFIVTDALLFSGLLCGYALPAPGRAHALAEAVRGVQHPLHRAHDLHPDHVQHDHGQRGDRRPAGRPQEGPALTWCHDRRRGLASWAARPTSGPTSSTRGRASPGACRRQRAWRPMGVPP